METIKSLEDLAGIFGETDTAKAAEEEKSMFRNKSKKIAFTVAYLLGVSDKYLEVVDENADERASMLGLLSKNSYAKILRALNNLRSNIILRKKDIRGLIRIDSFEHTPIYNIEFLKEDFKLLSDNGVDIYTGRDDLHEYLRIINAEISRRIDFVKPLFPEWIDFRHIKFMFDMPADTDSEVRKFQALKGFYPFTRYFNWIYPEDNGNILATDEKLLSVIYYNDGDTFMDGSRVTDASDNVKSSIKTFINNGKKVQVFIDGENADPYCFASALDSLREQHIEKIDKIVVYYDEMFSSRAWLMLQHFTYGVPVEAIPVSRVSEKKSLVDHKLVAGISKAAYAEDVDSFILVSSDSDFWAVMETVKANYLVMIERNKCGYDFRELMKNNQIFYCYLDLFQTPEDDEFFKAVFRRELENVITDGFSLGSAKALLDAALRQSRAHISEGAYENIYNRYIKELKLTINREGKFEIVIPK